MLTGLEKCLADGIYNELLAAPFNIVIDIVLMAIPIPLLWQSSMPLARKLALCVLLCGGLFTIIAIILRTTLSIMAVSLSFPPTPKSKLTVRRVTHQVPFLLFGSAESIS